MSTKVSELPDDLLPKMTPDGLDRLLAAIDLVTRVGGHSLRLRRDDQFDPPVWLAVATYDGRIGKPKHETGSDLDPTESLRRLAENLAVKQTCAVCRRVMGVSMDWKHRPSNPFICWYVYSPSRKAFVRRCSRASD